MVNPDTERAKHQATQDETSTSDTLDESYFKIYESHAKTLRSWLIVYGAAIPAYFLKEPTFALLLKDSGAGGLIIMLFLSGILMQVLQVFLYKIAMGYLYLGESNNNFKNDYRYKSSSWYSDQT